MSLAFFPTTYTCHVCHTSRVEGHWGCYGWAVEMAGYLGRREEVVGTLRKGVVLRAGHEKGGGWLAGGSWGSVCTEPGWPDSAEGASAGGVGASAGGFGSGT